MLQYEIIERDSSINRLDNHLEDHHTVYYKDVNAPRFESFHQQH